ncbi:hypothetical protein [Pseudomonas frederiksbergensis]|uniref:hypothetical protein n=1 Tax=Pseudomonas frederiksbergensis TaxID=104087 RepID=UPI003D1D4EFD
MDTQKLQTLVNTADAAHQELIKATDGLSHYNLREQGPQLARIEQLRKAHYLAALHVVSAVRTQLNFPALSEHHEYEIHH